MRACFGHFTDFRTSPATSCIRVAYYVNDEYTDILVTREDVKKKCTLFECQCISKHKSINSTL